MEGHGERERERESEREKEKMVFGREVEGDWTSIECASTNRFVGCHSKWTIGLVPSSIDLIYCTKLRDEKGNYDCTVLCGRSGQG